MCSLNLAGLNSVVRRLANSEKGVVLGLLRSVHQLMTLSPAKARVTTTWRCLAMLAPSKKKVMRLRKSIMENPSRLPLKGVG